MNNTHHINIFYNCNIDELGILYMESKLYDHFADIPETSPLFKYIKEFLDVCEYKSISMFYLDLTRAYIDKR